MASLEDVYNLVKIIHDNKDYSVQGVLHDALIELGYERVSEHFEGDAPCSTHSGCHGLYACLGKLEELIKYTEDFPEDRLNEDMKAYLESTKE